MKKQISIGIAIIACVALCAAVWPRSVEGGKVPAEPVKPAVIAEIEVKLEETSPITLSADNRTSEPELVAEIEPPIFEETTTEEKTEPTPPAKPAQQPATAAVPVQSSPDPKPGTIKIVHGERCMWIPGFGWIEDNNAPNVGTVAEDMYENGHKIRIMD